MAESSEVYPKPSGKFGFTKSLSFERPKLVGSSVHRLLHPGGPSAVARLVIAIYVDAIDAVFLAWAFSHVFKEILKPALSQPSIADFDTPSTVGIPLNVLF